MTSDGSPTRRTYVMKRFVETLRNEWPRYLMEVAVLVIGISLSFGLNEWRVAREAQRSEIRLLEGLRDNLRTDSLTLVALGNRMEGMIAGYDQLLQPVLAAQLPEDSLDLYMDMLITYTKFTRTDVTYEEMRQTGASRLISNTRLRDTVIGLYSTTYVRADEWDRIDSQFVLERMIPYLEAHAPYVPFDPSSGMFANRRPVYERLSTEDHFLNLVSTRRLFKSVKRSIYDATRAHIGEVIQLLEADLRRLEA